MNFPSLIDPARDPLGMAVWEYFQGERGEDILVHADIGDDDTMPVAQLFRKWALLPEYEQIALEHCRGKILDLGAGAGSHALILQKWGHEVTAMDISPGAVRTMRARGVKKVIQGTAFDLGTDQYDTILMMMNGLGVVGTLKGLETFLLLARRHLAPGGQIIMDSSDLSYLRDEGFEWEGNGPEGCYGEVEFQMVYKEVAGDPFMWLYADFYTLSGVAESCGYAIRLLARGPHYELVVALYPDGPPLEWGEEFKE